MTVECGIRIRVHGSLTPWQGNPDPSPRGSARPSSGGTQTTIWPSTRHAPPRKASHSATTSPASWPKHMASTSRPTSTAAATSQSCYSTRGRDPDLEMRRAPRDLESAGGSSNHPDEEGRSVLTCVSVPARAHLSLDEARCLNLPFATTTRYCVITRDDTSTRGGRCGCTCSTGSDFAEDKTAAHQRRRGPRSVHLAIGDTPTRSFGYDHSDPSALGASAGGPGAAQARAREGKAVGRRGGSATTSRLEVAEGPHPNLGGSVEPLTETKASCGWSASRRFNSAQIDLCTHREGTATERIRARLG